MKTDSLSTSLLFDKAVDLFCNSVLLMIYLSNFTEVTKTCPERQQGKHTNYIHHECDNDDGHAIKVLIIFCEKYLSLDKSLDV